MSNEKDDKKKISHNTSNQQERGAVNPSGPSTGTSGWGLQGGTYGSEANNIGGSNPDASHPGTEGAGDVRKTSYPRNEAADNPAASGGDRKRALEDNPNNRSGKSFRCADVGRENCNWSVTGTHEDEIVGRVRDHARDEHGVQDTDFKKMESRIRDAIRDRAA